MTSRRRPHAAASQADTTMLAPVLTEAGRTLLARLNDDDVADPLAATTRLRKAGHDPQTVAAALTQAVLRRDARIKLGPHADQMLFTRDGLEQATRAPVAEVRATRLRAAGIEAVADLGCGIGADTLAYAQAGLRVIAVERDPVVAAAATANAAALTPPGAVQVIAGDALEWLGQHGDDVDALWFDPARRQVGAAGAGGSARTGTARVFDPEAFSPPLSTVLELAARGRALGVKLGPGLPHEHVPDTAEAQWVSVDGDVVEVCLWFNALAQHPGEKTAVLLRADHPDDAGLTVTAWRSGDQSPAEYVGAVGESGLEDLPGRVLYEPDGAVIRAGLVADLAAQLSEATGVVVSLLDEHLAYLLAEEELPAPEAGPDLRAAARGYRIHAVHALDVKKLKRWVRERGITRLDIKKRGVDITPEALRSQLLAGTGKRGKGGRGQGTGTHATLVLARVGDQRVALEVEPLAHRGSGTRRRHAPSHSPSHAVTK
ncbi:MAG: class I SAM-dependent methyltransferase [Micrococcus sp.]|nr:class I SAM-dependent methyltransferase [Micrococcus sp.]